MVNSPRLSRPSMCEKRLPGAPCWSAEQTVTDGFLKQPNHRSICDRPCWLLKKKPIGSCSQPAPPLAGLAFAPGGVVHGLHGP